jgi:hypothetical protein
MGLFNMLFGNKINNDENLNVKKKYKCIIELKWSPKITTRVIFTLIITACSSMILGQTSINSSGGNTSTDNGSISYTLGQLTYQSASNLSGSFGQGVQQTYNISTLNLDEQEFNFKLSVYPNPTQDNLYLSIENYHDEQFTYLVLDIEAKVIKEAKVQSKEYILEMQQLPNATYYVDVHHSGKKVQSFKIIKSN